jgi:hypothetical protein
MQKIGCVIKYGFLLKYFNREQIVSWADKKISQGVDNFNVLELSLLKNKSDNEILILIDSLTGIIDNNYKNFLDGYFLGCYRELSLLNIYKSQSIKIEKEVLRYYSISDFELDDDEKLFISILNNDFSLRHEGLTGVLQIPEDLNLFLNKYTEYYELQKQLDDEGIFNLINIILLDPVAQV